MLRLNRLSPSQRPYADDWKRVSLIAGLGLYAGALGAAHAGLGGATGRTPRQLSDADSPAAEIGRAAADVI